MIVHNNCSMKECQTQFKTLPSFDTVRKSIWPIKEQLSGDTVICLERGTNSKNMTGSQKLKNLSCDPGHTYNGVKVR